MEHPPSIPDEARATSPSDEPDQNTPEVDPVELDPVAVDVLYGDDDE
jgi:hypothetical protein